MKIPSTRRINNLGLLKIASSLKPKGKLSISPTHLVYVDIDDHYIHDLYPILCSDDQDQKIIMPDYFGDQGVGAHITVIYPEEGVTLCKEDLGKEHEFVIKELIAARIGAKTYYVLLVESPSLLAIRRKYKLPDLLCFKTYSIGFHITIGVMLNEVNEQNDL